MPTNDIRVSLSLKDHRKLKRLIRLIGIGAMHHLVMLWLSTAEQCPTGHLKGWTEEDVAEAAQWQSDPKILIGALTTPNCLWLENNGDGFYIHDWEKHQGWVVGASARSEHARKAAVAKYMLRASPQHPPSIPAASSEQEVDITTVDQNSIPLSTKDILRASSEHPQSTAPSPSPSPSPNPYPTPSLLPKRRPRKHREMFDKLCKVYPRKDNLYQAEEVFYDLLDGGFITEKNLDADVIPLIEKSKTDPYWREENGKKIPHLKNWLPRMLWVKNTSLAPLDDFAGLTQEEKIRRRMNHNPRGTSR